MMVPLLLSNVALYTCTDVFSGKRYYYNKATKQSVWRRPLDFDGQDMPLSPAALESGGGGEEGKGRGSGATPLLSEETPVSPVAAELVVASDGVDAPVAPAALISGEEEGEEGGAVAEPVVGSAVASA